VVLEHARLDDELAVAPQGIHLGLDDLRMPGDGQVVIAVQADGIGAGHPALRGQLAVPFLFPALAKLRLHALAQARRQAGIERGRPRLGGGGGGEPMLNDFHGQLLYR
jgi:hypothetical protein